MNMPLVLLNRRRRGGPAAFSPTRLFALAEPGVWYDPSDLTTLFTDTAGTTPVTTPGQSVALALDKSKGLVLGSELVTNGNFSSGTTGWSGSGNATISVVDGWLRCVSNDGLVTNASTSFTTVVGTTYRITGQWRSNAGSWRIVVGTTAGGLTLYAPTGAASGTVDAYFVATTTTTFVSIRSVTISSGNYGELDNISVKELPGFHATQATAASRPTYGIVPLGGRRNLLTFTEQFDNAAWVKTAVTPNGLEVRETTANSAHSIFQNVSFTGTHTFSLELQAVGRDVYTIWMGTSSGTFAFIYTFSTNAISAVGTALSNVTATVLSGGWVRFTGNVVTPNRFQVSVGMPSSVYVGDPATGFNIRNAQLETGSTATAYQRVGSAFDVTEAGVPSLSYLSFDGVDDFLVTPTITPGTDKAQVFAGVRKLSDAAGAVLVEHSAAVVSNAGAFAIFAPSSAAPNYLFRSRGSATQVGADYTNALVAAPITNVLSGIGDISGDIATLRVNSIQVAQSTADQGTGNYLAYPIYIGRRGGTANPFNGQLYSMIVRFGANLDAGTITSTETWVNQRTGAF